VRGAGAVNSRPLPVAAAADGLCWPARSANQMGLVKLLVSTAVSCA
jgi:hypothetical protein